MALWRVLLISIFGVNLDPLFDISCIPTFFHFETTGYPPLFCQHLEITIYFGKAFKQRNHICTDPNLFPQANQKTCFAPTITYVLLCLDFPQCFYWQKDFSNSIFKKSDPCFLTKHKHFLLILFPLKCLAQGNFDHHCTGV